MFPILFKIGPIVIYSFGLFLGLGYLVASFLVYRSAKKEYLDEEKIFDAFFLTTIAGIIGARVFYIIEHFDSFGFNILNWLLINAKPGFSLWGGIGIALSVILLEAKRKKISVYKFLDILTYPILTLYIFGEIGSFFSGFEIGKPTNLPWGIVFFSTLKRHPISLYELVACLLTLVVLLFLQKIYDKKRFASGSLFFTFVLINSFLLFWIAFFREDVLIIGQYFRVDHFIYFILLLTDGVILYKRLGRSFSTDILKIKFILGKLLSSKGKTYEKIPGTNS